MIPNDKLLQMIDHQIAILDAFKQADQVLMQGVSGITDLITTPGLINLDFADVKAVMSNAGSALMGIGSARGEDRARAAAEMAVSSPLLEASIDGAHGVLLSIAGGSDLGLFEVSAAANLIQGAAHDDANIIFGTVIDDALGDEVRVTVIAAGFEGGQPPRRQPGSSRSAEVRTPPARPVPAPSAGDAGTGSAEPAPAPVRPMAAPVPSTHLRPSGAGTVPPTQRARRRRPRRTGLPQVAVRVSLGARAFPMIKGSDGHLRAHRNVLIERAVTAQSEGRDMAERLRRAAAWLGLVTDDRYADYDERDDGRGAHRGDQP